MVGGIKNAYQLISRYVQDDAMMLLPAASCQLPVGFFDFCETFIYSREVLNIYSIYIYIPDISPHPGLGSAYVSYVYLILLIPSIR